MSTAAPWDPDPEWCGDDPAREETVSDAEFAAWLHEENAAAAVSWALPGLARGDEGAEGLSRASEAALAELDRAWTALRQVQGWCYEALGALAGCDAVNESGYRRRSRLLADHLRINPAEARELARHADTLHPSPALSGAVLDTALPATGAAVDVGRIGPAHVEVIWRTLQHLERVPGVDPATLATTETELAGLACLHTPGGLAEAAAAIVALLDPDGTAPRDDRPPENELHYARRRGGGLSGKFCYRDPAAAELLADALAAATPAAGTEGLLDADGRGPAGVHGERGENPDAWAARTLPERRAHALLDLAAHALTHDLDTPDTPDPTDVPDPGTSDADPDLFDADPDPADADVTEADGADEADGAVDNGDATPEGEADTDGSDHRTPTGTPPAPPPTAPSGDAAPSPPPSSPPATLPPAAPPPVTLNVLLDFETLRGRLGATTTGLPPLALLGENTWVRPETARRLACDAELIPVVLGSRGEPLDVGRRSRTVPAGIRRAVVARDRHCAHPGCRRKARSSEVHHVTHWADGGETSLENCVLVCRYHHMLVHHSGWEIRMIDGMPWFVPPRSLDPTRQPRNNRPWQTLTAA